MKQKAGMEDKNLAFMSYKSEIADRSNQKVYIMLVESHGLLGKCNGKKTTTPTTKP